MNSITIAFIVIAFFSLFTSILALLQMHQNRRQLAHLHQHYLAELDTLKAHYLGELDSLRQQLANDDAQARIAAEARRAAAAEFPREYYLGRSKGKQDE